MTGDIHHDPLISVIVPVFDEAKVLPELHRRLADALTEVGGRSEIVYVDDGSQDESAHTITSLAAGDERVVLIQLSRNFGMVRLADRGADVVFTRRIGRDESFVKRALATGFYGLMSRLAKVPYQGQAGDFRLLSRRVVEAVQDMPERRRFLRGMIAWTGFRQVSIEYQRAGRTTGREASCPALFRLGIEALASFSDAPLALAAYVGILTAALSGFAATAILALSAVGIIEIGVVVWILVAVLFLGGVQLICMGSWVATSRGSTRNR